MATKQRTKQRERASKSAEVDPLSENAPLKTQLEYLHDTVGIKDRELAFIGSVSVSTARRWRRKGVGERPIPLDDLRFIVREMRDGSALSPTLIGGWLRSRNRGLGMDRPIDALRNRDFEGVLRAAEAAIAGVAPPDGVAVRVANSAGDQAVLSERKKVDPPTPRPGESLKSRSEK